MPRSIKKGPFVEKYLLDKISKLRKASKDNRTMGIRMRTYSRRSMIVPAMIDVTMEVHNGRDYIPVFITKDMVGHKLGEFSPTRTFRAHSGDRKVKAKDGKDKKATNK